MKRIAIALVLALGCAACTRLVVLEPPPDSNNTLPDAVSGHDGGGGDGGVQDGGGLPDAGVIGDAALGG